VLIAGAQAYDIVEPSSFAKAKFWVNELQQHGTAFSPHRLPADTPSRFTATSRRAPTPAAWGARMGRPLMRDGFERVGFGDRGRLIDGCGGRRWMDGG
jgi:hypothetical protein